MLSSKLFRPLSILLLWSLIVTAVVGSLWSQRIGSTPPVWDGLAYQVLGLQFLNHFSSLAEYHSGTLPWGWIFLLAGSFSVSNLSPWGPFFLGAACMILFLWGNYLLMRICKVQEWTALGLVLILASFPNFLYQNLLQSRNDYPVATFLCFSVILFLKAREAKKNIFFVLSGVLFGIAALIKLSAPAYLSFSFFIYFLGFFQNKENFKVRLQNLLLFAVGFVLTAGLIYSENFDQTLDYYKYWASMSEWIADQYSLSGPSDFVFFYPKNLLNYHFWLPSKLIFQVALVFVLAGGLLFYIRSRRSLRAPCFELKFILSLWALPLLFLTFRGSLSQLGDIPVHPFFFASIGVFLNSPLQFLVGKIYLVYRKAGSFFVALSILIFSVYGVFHIRIEEPPSPRDFQIFVQKISMLRSRYKLACDPGFSLFSHPYYSFDTALWYEQVNHQESCALHSASFFSLIRPNAIAKDILDEVSKNISILMTSQDAIAEKGGESFHTFNKIQKDLNAEFAMRNSYIKVDSLRLPNEKWDIDFWIRSDKLKK